MRSKSLCGSLIEDNLRNVDDARVIDAIGRACFAGLLPKWTFTSGDALAFGMMLGVAIGAQAWGEVLSWPEWCRWVPAAFLGAGTVLIVFRRLKRRLREVLPAVLRGMGRCGRCGYKLDGRTCPQCGTSVEAWE